jgi:transposase
MRIDWDTVRIYVRSGGTDMRKQINGLSALVQEDFPVPALSGDLFVFCNKRRNRLKILYWQKNGFCLWLKRLEKHKFPWPKDGDTVLDISQEQLAQLLDGIDFWHAHSRLEYSEL